MLGRVFKSILPMRLAEKCLLHTHTHTYTHSLTHTCDCSQLAMLGKVFKSVPPVRLTEEDTEYNVFCIKHVFEEHIVFQFDCTNTISEQVRVRLCLCFNYLTNLIVGRNRVLKSWVQRKCLAEKVPGTDSSSCSS